MRQAGRFLPEYRALRAKVSFTELCRTPDLCAEVTLQPLARFDLDAAIVFSDILVVLDVFGIPVEWTPAPRIAVPVRSGEDLGRMRRGDVETELAYVFEAVKACKRALGERVPLIGFCGAPFTTASYIVEGGGSDDFLHTKRLMYREPVAFGRLLERITTVLSTYVEHQVRAGADAIQIFDSWAGALAPSDYRAHVLPHLGRLVNDAKALGVPIILFVRGNAELLREAAALRPDVVGVDWGIELDRAIDIVGPDVVVQGNLDPAAMLAPPDVMAAKADGILRAGDRARSHVFNLGHGILPETEPEMVGRLVDLVHAHREPASDAVSSDP